MQKQFYMGEAEKLSQLIDKAIWPSIITAAVTSIVLISTLIYNIWALMKQIKEKRREERRKEISQKLNEFYGPFLSYLNSSKELFKIFSSGKPKDFRTLTYLLDPNQKYKDDSGKELQISLTEVDREILKEIIEIGQKLDELIISKAGLIDDPALRYDYTFDSTTTDVSLQGNGLLTYAKVHFQIIRLANEGRLKGEVSRFKNYVYPRELNGKIEAKIKELQAELKSLTKT